MGRKYCLLIIAGGLVSFCTLQSASFYGLSLQLERETNKRGHKKGHLFLKVLLLLLQIVRRSVKIPEPILVLSYISVFPMFKYISGNSKQGKWVCRSIIFSTCGKAHPCLSISEALNNYSLLFVFYLVCQGF